MFRHPTSIRTDRALAVWAVMHNKGTSEGWQVLDDWVDEDSIEWVLDQIVDVLEMNGSTRLVAERDWWADQLSRGPA